ncbi:hypothetical protein BGZ83_010156, partial [Gryganskiella cystojenkinii]
SGGPGRVLSEILSRDGDPRALLTIKDHVPPEIAIAKAVMTRDRRLLSRTLAIWGSNVSDGGLKLAIEMDVPYAVDVVEPSMEETIRYRNAYYISKGRYDDVDKSIDRPYDEVFAVPDRVRLQGILDQCSTAVYPLIVSKCNTPQEFLEIFASWDRRMQEEYTKLMGTGLDPEIVVGISNMGFGTPGSLDRERLTKEQIMRTTRWQGRHLRDLFTYGFGAERISLTALECVIGTIIKEGMERNLLEYLENNSHLDLMSDNMVIEIITHLGYKKALSGRWGRILHETLCESAIYLVCVLGGNAGVRIIEMGYELALRKENILYDLPCACAMKLLEMYGENIMYQIKIVAPVTVEEIIWLTTVAKRYSTRRSSDHRPEMREGIYYIPDEVHVTPYIPRGMYSWITSVDRWLLAADMTLCAMNA